MASGKNSIIILAFISSIIVMMGGILSHHGYMNRHSLFLPIELSE